MTYKFVLSIRNECDTFKFVQFLVTKCLTKQNKMMTNWLFKINYYCIKKY